MQIVENAILSVTLYATQDSFCGKAPGLTAGFLVAGVTMVEKKRRRNTLSRSSTTGEEL
jgi:hypothetical protein